MRKLRACLVVWPKSTFQRSNSTLNFGPGRLDGVKLIESPKSPTVKVLYEINRSLRDENVSIKIRNSVKETETRRGAAPNTLSDNTDHVASKITSCSPSTDLDQMSNGYKEHENHYKLQIEGIQKKLEDIPTPKQLKAYLDKFIIGQEKCKKIMSVAVYNHYIRMNDSLVRGLEHEYAEARASKLAVKKQLLGAQLLQDTAANFSLDAKDLEKEEELPELEKSNIMLIGPSGSGKTLIAKTLAKVLKVPIVIQDCTSLTQAGYVGEDIESCVEKLFERSDFDVSQCERGIIVLDELDKLSKPSANLGVKDISGEGVQQGLLKLIEGTNVTVQPKKHTNKSQVTSSKNKEESSTIDTSNILFITMGAFVGLDNIIAARVESSTNVQEAVTTNPMKKRDHSKQIREVKLPDGSTVSSFELVTSEDLVSFGLIPEFIGRIPVIASLQALTESDLEKILTEPRNSIIKQYEYLFSRIGVRLAITKEAIKLIASASINSGTGARGLRTMLEKLLLSANYDCPGSGISFVLVDKDTVQRYIEKGNAAGVVNAKYHGRGDVYKFLTQLHNEDPELAKKVEQELHLPKSLRADLDLSKAIGNGKPEREYVI